MNISQLKLALEIPFPPERIHWRCGARTKDKGKGIPLAYIDARDVMRRLDDVMGFNWQNKYTLADNGLLICDIGLLIPCRQDDVWLWRSNGAGDTQVEAEKGKASDAFKRAAVMWGIGRYLYSLPNEWLPIDQYGKFTQTPKLPSWATPEGYTKAMELKADVQTQGLQQGSYTEEQKEEYKTLLNEKDAIKFLLYVQSLPEGVSNDLANCGPVKRKTAFKNAVRDLIQKGSEQVDAWLDELLRTMTAGDPYACQYYDDLEEAKPLIDQRLTKQQAEQLAMMKELAA